MSKHELKCEEIINTAFLEWGKSFFSNTSLSLISNKLRITKPAFYRYFNKKEDLQDAMIDRFLNDFIKVTFSIKDYKKIGFNEFLFEYINNYVIFFLKNPHYIYFFPTIVRKDYFINNIKFIQISLREKRYFKHFIKISKLKILVDEIDSVIGYFYCTIFIFLFKEMMVKINNKENYSFSDKEIKNLTDISFKIISNGFAEKKDSKIDFLEIEKYSSVQDNEIIQRDKIFDAITCVIAKEGIWKASLKKIAESAGMSKSGFYFYYKNKEVMFGNMFFDEITRIYDLIQKRQSQFKNFFEKLYCNIIVEASYLLKDTRIVYFFDWLHFQKININFLKKNKKKFNVFLNSKNAFIKEAIDNNILKDYSLDLESIASFLNIQIVKEIIIKCFNNKESYIKDMRKIYNLFLHGINFYST